MVQLEHTRVLVTGGAGFIGSCLVRDLVLSDRVQVLTLDKLTYAGHLASLAAVTEQPMHRFVHGDICDSGLVRQLLADFRPTAVVHLAAETHVDRSIDAPAEFVRTNVEGTLLLLEQTLAYWQQCPRGLQHQFRFLHVSTDEVYGALGSSGAFTETTPYAPNSPYAASKAASDHFVRAYHQTYGLPTLTTNCSNNYGPYQLPEKLIPLMILNALEGRALPVYGDGLQVRDWLHVGDHSRALRTVLRGGQPGQVYNVGGGAERTNLEMVQTICQIVDDCCPELPHRPTAQLIKFVDDRPGHDRRYAVDTTKIEQALGWRPQASLESGLRQTVQWYLQHDAWISGVSHVDGLRQRRGLSSKT